MSDTIKPLGDRIVAVQEEAPDKTVSGLYLPETAKDKPVFAKVTAVGPEVKAIKIGDNILYKNYSTTEVKINNKQYLIIKEEDILATI